MANYELKPRLNRLDGVATVIVQGGQEPEFHITPDPAKLLAAGVTVSDVLDAVRRTNLIDSPGLLEQNHQLYLGLVNGQVTDPEQIGQIVIKTTPAGVPVRIADVASRRARRQAGLHRRHRQREAGDTAEHQPPARQQHRGCCQRSPCRDRAHPPDPCLRASSLQPFYDQSEIVTESIKSVRDAILIGVILASLIMVLFLRDWGTSIVAVLVIPVTVVVTFIVLEAAEPEL